MCWGGGITLSSVVVRVVVDIEGDMGWRLPLMLQWMWPLPLFIGIWFAPESPWSCVRRDKLEGAAKAVARLRQDTPDKERDVAATVALIRHTTAIERAETAGSSFLQCFKGTNLRRTEIVSSCNTRNTRSRS